METKRMRERLVREVEARGVSDRRVLDALRRVPRHRFVEEGFAARAYGDYPLPIGLGQTISQPSMVGLMTQALELVGNEKVLEIGTGSGYQAAVLAEIVPRVFSIERLAAVARRTRALLDELGYHRVQMRIGDGTRGWPEEAPFEAIIVTAGAPRVPAALVEQLADGGRLVIPVGGESVQTLLRLRRRGGIVEEERLTACVFVKLIGAEGWQAGPGDTDPSAPGDEGPGLGYNGGTRPPKPGGR